MKVAINTIVDDHNYGNRLQNYALQQVLCGLGIDAQTIDRRARIQTETKAQKLTDAFLDHSLFYRISQRVKHSVNSSNRLTQKTVRPNLAEFSRNNICFLSSDDPVKTVNNSFDLLLTGSDQVWNYHFWSGPTIEFGRGIHIRKASYAASIGVSRIPNSLRRAYVEGLRDYEILTMREQAGADLVKQLTGRPAAVVLDPTMLLPVSEWRALSKKSRFAQQPLDSYVLAYFLTPPSQAIREKIDSFAADYGVNIYYLFEIINEKAVGVEDLLWLIEHASIVFGDSFHASVFSILFRRPFQTLTRSADVLGNMQSRLDTLFSTLSIPDGGVSLDEVGRYDEIFTRLDLAREKSMSILKNILNE